jgi:hypothetical protein
MRSLNQSVFHAITFFIIVTTALSPISCGEREPSLFFTAKVLDLWGQTTVVENFRILYTWEERGETPFLKPYTYHAKVAIVEVMRPVPGDAHHVNIVTRKIPLQDIHAVEFIRGEVGNTIQIQLKNNERIIATDRFPQVLKKGKNTGLADYAVYIEGTVIKEGKKEAFQLELNKVKKVEIMKVTM